MKTCNKCGSSGPFAKMAKAPDGLEYSCKSCKSAYGKANRRSLTATQVAWRRNNPERFKVNQAAAYARANPKALRDRRAKYYAENRDTILAKRRDAYARNGVERARRLAYTDTRLAKIGAGRVLAEDWRKILEFFDYRCAYCLSRGGRLAMDHVIALSRGGEHSPENIVPACKYCNSKKGAKPAFSMVNTTLSW